jgi:hypothetical protein
MKNLLLLLMFLSSFVTVSAQQIMQFDPQALEATLNPNDSAVVYTILHNNGSDTLHFAFPAYLSRGSGGPDAFGYTWIDSDEEGGPNYEWIEISETGTPITGLMDDNVVGPFSMGFDFPYYWHNKNQFWINSNGCISFTDHLVSFANYPIPTNGECTDFIAWFWDDLTVDTNITKAYYQVFDNRVVVQFEKFVHYPGSEQYVTAEVVMMNTGMITIRYKQVIPGLDLESCTVGIQSGEPGVGLQVVYNAPYIHSELAVRFDRGARSFITSVSPSAGFLLPGAQEHIWITYSSVGFEPGTYEQELQCISMNDTTIPPAWVHNVMHVSNPVSAGFKGYVTNAADGSPINDVRVSVGEHYVYTNMEGHYELPLEQGVYNVTFLREGYQTLIVEDTTAVPGFSILDVQLNGFFFLAGRVWAGENPIETGFAYSYKMLEGQVVDIYAEMVGAEGYYEFSGLAAAQYIVKAEPSPNSIYYGSFLPTYYGDVLHWEDATVINLTQNMDGAIIHLLAVSNAQPGPGSIGGHIESGGNRVLEADVPVILKSESTGYLNMILSDAEGHFEFGNLEYGTYKLFAEIPGKTIVPMSITLDETNPNINDIVMVIMQSEIVFMGIEDSPVFESVSEPYPNPSEDIVSVLVNVKKAVNINVTVTDRLGQTISKSIEAINVSGRIELDVRNLPAGVYFLTLTDGEHQGVVKRFMRK